MKDLILLVVFSLVFTFLIEMMAPNLVKAEVVQTCGIFERTDGTHYIACIDHKTKQVWELFPGTINELLKRET